MSVWNPALYERFKAERRQPFFDLLSLVQPQPDMRVLDLGCGTGELTAQLHAQLRARHTIGIDSSPTMLARSATWAGPEMRFEKADIGRVRISPPRDLVFSNAALHWLAHHEGLLPHIVEQVARGGQLAIQMPANNDHPSHSTADEVAAEPAFAQALGGWVREPSVMPLEWYDARLRDLGFTERHVRLQIYGHELPRTDEVVTWVRGSVLTAYESRLDPRTFERFIERYTERLFERLPAEEPYYYQYKRILIWGRRS